jgi:hypothetical protein
MGPAEDESNVAGRSQIVATLGRIRKADVQIPQSLFDLSRTEQSVVEGLSKLCKCQFL